MRLEPKHAAIAEIGYRMKYAYILCFTSRK